MQKIKSILGKAIRSALPLKLRMLLKLILHPYILPRIYRERLANYERVAKQEFEIDNECQASKLRMYVHTLDKGLHRKGLEPGHSREIYLTAVKILREYTGIDDDTIGWARLIISEYEYRQSMEKETIEPLKSEPVTPIVSSDTLMKFMKMRTSCRQYKNQTVSTEAIETITQAALESPWSCSRQALKVYSTTDLELTYKALNYFSGFTCFSKYVPSMFVFCVDLRPYTLPMELFVPTLDAGLAVENAVLMAFSLGASMTLLTWGSRTMEQERGLRKLFGIPDYYEIVVGAACGYPENWAVRPARKNLKKTLIMKACRE